MPNCDFYALRQDHAEVLGFVFAETSCRVFEKDSKQNAEIREFSDVDAILNAYDAGAGPLKVLLNLYDPAMRGEFKIRRIDLDSKRFGEGAHR